MRPQRAYTRTTRRRSPRAAYCLRARRDVNDARGSFSCRSQQFRRRRVVVAGRSLVPIQLTRGVRERREREKEERRGSLISAMKFGDGGRNEGEVRFERGCLRGARMMRWVGAGGERDGQGGMGFREVNKHWGLDDRWGILSFWSRGVGVCCAQDSKINCVSRVRYFSTV